MNIRKTGLVAMITTSLLLGSAGAAFAHGNFPGKSHGKCDRQGPSRMLNRLDDVTDAQREQIEALLQERRGQMQSLRGEMQESRKAMREAIARGASRDELRMLADQQAAHVSTMMLSRAETAQQVQGVLTEAQREQLQELRQKRMERHGDKKGMHKE
jgi:Spy/CpxP family protein refolding chaperone